MKTEGLKQQRMADAIREKIATSIIHELKDPRVQGLMITITKVEMTPDLKLARVYVSILDKEKDHQKILKGLKNAKGFLKSKVGQNIKLRHVPDLEFKLDESLDYSERIDQLLKEAKQS